MGAVYFAFMMFGAFTVRVPAAGLAAGGYDPPPRGRLVTTANVRWTTPRRRRSSGCCGWCSLNVTAGIGILGQASPMIQDIFRAGVDGRRPPRGFVGLLTLFNMGGRFVWSSTSDLTGRKRSTGLLRVGGRPVRPRRRWRKRQRALFVLLAGDDHLDVRRRLRDDPGLPPRPVRHDAAGRHPRPADHRVVGRRGRRSADRQRPRRPAESNGGCPAPTCTRCRGSSWLVCPWSASWPT